MTPRLSGNISIFGLGITKKWSGEKFAIFSLKLPFQRGMVRGVGGSPPPPPPPHLLELSVFIYGQEPHNYGLRWVENEDLALKSQLFTLFRVDSQLRSQAPLRLAPLSLRGTNKRRRALGTGLVDRFL